MSRIAVPDSERMNLRVSGPAKARLMRAAALRQTDLTRFVTESALREADAVIAESDRVQLSERDGLKVLALLENPPGPNAKMLAAAKALARDRR